MDTQPFVYLCHHVFLASIQPHRPSHRADQPVVQMPDRRVEYAGKFRQYQPWAESVMVAASAVGQTSAQAQPRCVDHIGFEVQNPFFRNDAACLNITASP